MKIIKMASGKKKVKMSKSEWQSIGKTAGWNKRAQSESKVTDWITSQIKELMNNPDRFWAAMRTKAKKDLTVSEQRKALRDMIKALTKVNKELNMFTKDEKSWLNKYIISLNETKDAETKEDYEGGVGLADPAEVATPLAEPQDQGVLEDIKFMTPKNIEDAKNELLDRFSEGKITEEQLKNSLTEFAKNLKKQIRLAMRVTKTANGKKKVILSKNDWEKIGKISGWEKESQVQAPTKAPTKTPTKTPEKGPDKQSPFNPPRPKIDPKPKAKKKLIDEFKDNSVNLPTFGGALDRIIKMSQTYEEGASKAVRDFWMNVPQEHPFSQNPILSEYGHNLSQEGYDYIVQKMQQSGKQPPRNEIMARKEAMSLMQQIFELESAHEEELINAAKDITAEVWGIDRNQLNAGINQSPEKGEEQEDKEHNLVPVTPEIKKEIDKRVMMNTLTQGAAVHAMYSVHHLVAELINNISPELLSLYSRLSAIATHSNYIVDIIAMIRLLQENLDKTALGWTHVEFGEENKQPKVFAQGICFPVLCQELFKGVMELLSLHGINQNLSEDELYTVYHHADRLEDEPWLITVGPALWRKFISVLPEGANLSEVVMKFNQESPDKVNQIIRSIIQNPESAKTYFTGLKEPEKVDLWQDTEEAPEVPEELPGDISEDNGGEMDDWLKGIIEKDIEG